MGRTSTFKSVLQPKIYAGFSEDGIMTVLQDSQWDKMTHIYFNKFMCKYINISFKTLRIFFNILII